MKEVKVSLNKEGLEFSEYLSPEELAVAINNLADTYCKDANCGRNGHAKCEVCQVGDYCHKIRKELLK